MLPYFPKKISYRAILAYLIALFSVAILYTQYLMKTEYILLGIISVVAFFIFLSDWSKNWTNVREVDFCYRVFSIAFVIRLIWVVFSYYYYINTTGNPFEYGAADSIGYHEEAAWLREESWEYIFHFYFKPGYGVSDVGYPLYLTLIYKIFGPVVIVPRLFKALWSAGMCLLIYRLSKRTFGESTARMAGIMCALMPNFIIYCGYHLKETEMLFLEVAFLDRLDYVIRERKTSFFNTIVATLLALSLFFFRSVLGAAGFFAFASAVLFSSTPTMKRGWRRIALVSWGILCLLFASGGTIITEVESYWERRADNLSNKRLEQTSRGNQWAQYATGAVMAPMAFVLPFSTMVDVQNQLGQQEKHGGNYVRNFMGFFAILAVYEAFRRKQWRDFSLIGSFVMSYLGVVALSGFSNSERFLLPGLPCLIMMWAYGVSVLREKTFKLLTPWCFVVVVMEIAWAFFKLGSRGLF